jgi:hypothetical protein
MNFSFTHPSFDIKGLNGTAVVRTSWMGYDVLLRVGDCAGIIVAGSPALISSVRLSLKAIHLSPNTAILAFKIENLDSLSHIVDVSVTCDITFQNQDRAPVWGLPGRRGFIVYSPSFTLAWALR